MVNKTTEYTRNIFKTTLVDFIIALERSVRTYSAIGSSSIAVVYLFNAQMTLGCNSICNSISSSGF